MRAWSIQGVVLTTWPESAMRFSSIVCLFILAAANSAPAGAVGFRHFSVPASHHEPALEAVVWYPAESGGTPLVVGDTPILEGQSVRLDAGIPDGRRPLVVLSHGYSGHWNNQGWLAVELVRAGYIVAAVNHPGTTAKDMNVARAARLWERPRDISRTIDALARDPLWSSAVDGNRVAAVGHSLGGWTVVELAGGRVDPDRLDADCKAHTNLAACELLRKIDAGKDAASRFALARALEDPRIKAIVSLDLGLTGAFDPVSLVRIDRPVLVIAAGVPNEHIPAALESRRLAGFLPAATTRYVEIPGAAHFSFLSVCKPGGAALLAKESPEDAIVCTDGKGADRAAIHRQVADEVIRFLTAALPLSEPRGS
jgi:predicted dienelactone hydrolase